ncbi:hypothetical protein Ccrd_014433 [Cynara cardunculus var. scolymus]|uniref:Uncharacterized protein n=1 Tax=Cynara cardunculus var. scolymus TaxID=59895 RepID=A0A118K4A6_CYNCS|nr:hypothetical protein Ccrd_014433 [Cynara cardunculus var. scolymus]
MEISGQATIGEEEYTPFDFNFFLVVYSFGNSLQQLDKDRSVDELEIFLEAVNGEGFSNKTSEALVVFTVLLKQTIGAQHLLTGVEQIDYLCCLLFMKLKIPAGLENSDMKDKLSPTNGQPRLPGMPSISFGKALARSKARVRISSSRTNPTPITIAMLTSISLVPSDSLYNVAVSRHFQVDNISPSYARNIHLEHKNQGKEPKNNVLAILSGPYSQPSSPKVLPSPLPAMVHRASL